jgi:hypothetical protein
MANSNEFTLLYGDIVIGQVRNCICNDDTWHGTLIRIPLPVSDSNATRAIDYIAFCSEWNGRVSKDPGHPPDAEEFKRFSDVVQSGMWKIVSRSGKQSVIEDAPLFFDGGELSWRLLN